MMENQANRMTLSISRLINQRDAMHLLLSPPSSVPSGGRRHSCILDGDLSTLSLNELASLLSAMMDEMGAPDFHAHMYDDSSEAIPGVSSSRKRRRTENGNNCHAILLFVERLMYERFSPDSNHYEFVQKEFKTYFGIHEPSFKIQEEIICLAFLMSLHAIKQCIPQQNPSSGQDSSDVLNIPNATNNEPVVNTALRIIDYIVTTSKRERMARMSTDNTTNDATYPRDDQAGPLTRRQRYQFLLRNDTPKNDIAQKNETLIETVPSVIEDLYPRQWMWLNDFRRKFDMQIQEEVQKNTATRSTNYTSSPSQQSGNETQKVSDLCKTSNESPVSVNTTAGEKYSNDVVLGIEKSTLHLDEMHEDADARDSNAIENNDVCNNTTTDDAPLKTEDISLEPPPALTPLDELDKKANELRKSLISMPPSDLSHAVEDISSSIIDLLKQYGDIDGASGIGRCGDVINGVRILKDLKSESMPEEVVPLSDGLVSSLVKQFLTDATGALRAKAFLKSFVLPLMLQMNGTTNQGKPASRLITSLLTSLARDRPIECVESLLVPTLVCELCDTVTEPNRFQCELVARILRGKDAISIPAIALFIEKILLSSNESTHEGMPWTEHSMPLVSACLNRQPPLSDVVVVRLANRVKHYLSPANEQVMGKSMKFSTIFHVLVSKFGQQLKEVGEAASLKEAVIHLKTFMSKTINTVLSKL